MKRIFIIASICALASFGITSVHAMGDMKKPAAQSAAAATIKGKGVVVSVNPQTGKITLKHEPIPALEWPAMTMGFKIKDKSQLDKLRKGDKVDFTLEKSGTEYLISDIK